MNARRLCSVVILAALPLFAEQEAVKPPAPPPEEDVSPSKTVRQSATPVQKNEDPLVAREERRGEDGGPYKLKEAVRRGDISVEVVGMAQTRVDVKTIRGETQTDEEYLVALIEITNHSETRKINYLPWIGAIVSLRRDFATLADELGNTYKRIDSRPLIEVQGQRTEQASIYPGKSIRDVLVFERPVDAGKYLDLTLPLRNLGMDGELTFRGKRAVPNSSPKAKPKTKK